MVDRDPGNGPARFGLANELVRAGRFEEARLQLSEYLAMHDDEGAAYRLLGAANERLGCIEDAREAYRRGIAASERHGHPGMAEEFRMRLEDLD
jgi:E3 SUMO-protein ligase RanBP2